MRRTVAILGLVSGIAAAPAAWAQSGMMSPTPPPAEKSPTDGNEFKWQHQPVPGDNRAT